MQELADRVELDQGAARFIAAGLHELAAVDGVHELEIRLIREFEQGVEGDPVPFDLDGQHPLETAELRELFMRSAILLALADGKISELEGDLIGRYAHKLAVRPERLAELYRDVKMYLLSTFEDATLFREQVEDIGRDLGLDDAEIKQTLT